ncbi:hypothetical protein IWQ47_004277 [Aquimarina sp. EL_43]|nr:hypothetical protein [Aquimarina sp. EL_35]MBG6152352.1 hypothetical protein [Aquimarina sp. EL_32]MBG6171190.1 hypothetical protein [Aquimarina sp. EL_43]
MIISDKKYAEEKQIETTSENLYNSYYLLAEIKVNHVYFRRLESSFHIITILLIYSISLWKVRY